VIGFIHLRREVSEGAKAITEMIGVTPHWYRGATAEYDADAGATLGRWAIAERLKHVKSGDVIIAHMNKPASDSAEGLSLGLIELMKRGFQFVRLDQVKLAPVP
jgi:hypothetical protein